MDRVSHFEIPADNVERAQKFYSSVFRWSIHAMPEMGYTIFRTGPTGEDGMLEEKGFINGGMMKRQDPIKSPVITIMVKDIQESVEKVKKSGGEVIKAPFPVGDMGISAYIKDTEGNIIGLWQQIKM